MKYLASLALALAVAQAIPVKRADPLRAEEIPDKHEGPLGAEEIPVKHAYPLGIDVSSHQPNVDWTAVVHNGIKFAYIKATEGTSYISPSFSSQYTGSAKAGLIRGSYHFALPDVSSGAIQANYFVAHGGSWSADGITLPGAIDIEYNPYGAKCYGLSASGMVAWLKDFSNTYHSKTGRYPVIYTTTDWWKTCTGNNAGFGTENPLWIADWASTLGTLPAGWTYTSFWQYANSGPNPGDADRWNGDYDDLQRYDFSSGLEWDVNSLAPDPK